MQWLFFWMYKCIVILFSFSMGRSFWNPNFTLSPNTAHTLSCSVLCCPFLTFISWSALNDGTHTHTHGCFYFLRWNVQFFTFSFKWWKSEKEMICNQTKGLVLRFRAPYENVGTPCYRIQRSRWINYQVAGDPDRWIERSEPSCSNALYDMDKKVLDKKPIWHVAPHHRRGTESWIWLVSHCSESRKVIF
jgi:hypothetical protein